MEAFKAIRRAGVSLVGWETADPAMTVQACMKLLNGKGETTPVLGWDICNGATGLNQAGIDAMSSCEIDPMQTLNPTEFLSLLRNKVAPKKSPLEDCVVFFSNGQRFIDNEGVLQGIWNLRDSFKSKHCTLVLMGPVITLPPELKHDVVIISEPLPGDAELRAIVKSIADDTAVDAVKKQASEQLEYIVDVLRGLSAFAAEQVLALSVTRDGVDMSELWERKRKMIEQTPGLQVWKGGESFDDLGGLTNLKAFLTKVLTSQTTPCRAILFCDEIEKQLGGAQGDTSGTSQDQLGTLLRVMQDDNVPGMILIGHGGCGKSAIAKAAGTVAQCPVVACDLGAMKGSLVGQSEARIRAAMDVFKAISQGKGMVIATCNRISSLPPELRRRFTLGTFMVDLPDEAERKTIWSLWLKRYKLKEKALDDCEGFTGAEIRAVCDVAYRTGLSLAEAVKYIVPVIKAAPDQVEALRKMAHGRFISASKPGIYIYNQASAEPVTSGRRMQV